MASLMNLKENGAPKHCRSHYSTSFLKSCNADNTPCLAWPALPFHDDLVQLFSEPHMTKSAHKVPTKPQNLRFFGKKSISPPHLWRMDYVTPNLWNSLYQPLNFPKPIKLSPKAVLKNYSKSQKNHKIENSIVLGSKWVDLHCEHII